MERIRTLIVEDEHTTLVNLIKMFPLLCEDLAIVGSTTALSHALIDKYYDLIICDKDIQGGSTREFWINMTMRCSEAQRVIVWSAGWTNPDQEYARGLGVTVLHKPDTAALKRAVSDVIARALKNQ